MQSQLMDRTELFSMLKDLVAIYQSGALSREEFQDTKQFLLSQIGQQGHVSGSHQELQASKEPSYPGVPVTVIMSRIHAEVKQSSPFMAPEIRQGEVASFAAADVYTCGVLAYYLLTGVWPASEFQAPSQLQAGLPSDVDDVLRKALATDPEQRWEAAVQMAEALVELLQPRVEKDAASEAERATLSLFQAMLAYSPEPVAPSESMRDSSQENLRDSSVQANPLLPSGRLLPKQSGSSANMLPKRSRPTTGSKIRAYSPLPKNDRSWTSEQILSLDRSHSMLPLPLQAGRMQTPPPASALSVPTPEHLLATQVEEMELSLILEEHTDTQELALQLESSLPPSSPYHALHLPSVPDGLPVKILQARDGTPLLQLVQVTPGPFLMGASPDDREAAPFETPQRTVDLEAYWISRTLITNRVWLKFIQESGYHNHSYNYLQHWQFGRPGVDQLEHPVVYISAQDLEHFCKFYGAAIPTEEQWEKAARGTKGQTWSWGNQKPNAVYCNYLGSNIHRTTPVASYPEHASPFGLLDCSGNVWEWCQLSPSLPPLPPQPSASQRYMLRGGCFRDYARNIRCSTRCTLMEPSEYIGARVVVSIK